MQHMHRYDVEFERNCVCLGTTISLQNVAIERILSQVGAVISEFCCGDGCISRNSQPKTVQISE
jgi:hypothetical protein